MQRSAQRFIFFGFRGLIEQDVYAYQFCTFLFQMMEKITQKLSVQWRAIG